MDHFCFNIGMFFSCIYMGLFCLLHNIINKFKCYFMSMGFTTVYYMLWKWKLTWVYIWSSSWKILTQKNDCFFVYLLSKVNVDSFVQILISMLYTRLYIEFLQFFFLFYREVTNIVAFDWYMDETWIGAQREFCVCCKPMNLYPLMT